MQVTLSLDLSRTMNASIERSIPIGDIKISRRGSCSPNYAEPDHVAALPERTVT